MHNVYKVRFLINDSVTQHHDQEQRIHSWLLTFLPEDLGSIPSTHMAQLTTVCNSGSRRSFRTLLVSMDTRLGSGTQTHMQAEQSHALVCFSFKKELWRVPLTIAWPTSTHCDINIYESLSSPFAVCQGKKLHTNDFKTSHSMKRSVEYFESTVLAMSKGWLPKVK